MSTTVNYDDFDRQSIDPPDAFWAEQAKPIDWFKSFERVCNGDNRAPVGTGELDGSISGHAWVVEGAVVGVADNPKGQFAMAFVVLKDASALNHPAALQQIKDRMAS